MRTVFRQLAVSLFCLLLAGIRPATAEDPPVTIFAAASLKPALDQILSTDGTPAVRVSYGGSSALARQILFGAPADIFLAANTQWMDAVETAGLIIADSRRSLLSNQLVLIARRDAPVPSTIAEALDTLQHDDRIAMALVDAVPAGIYGKAALMSLGMWSRVSPQVVQSDNVRAALRFVESGEVLFGVVYATDTSADVVVVGAFPQDSHPPIRYPIAMLGSPSPSTQSIYELLTSPIAKSTFETYGFRALGDNK